VEEIIVKGKELFVKITKIYLTKITGNKMQVNTFPWQHVGIKP